MYTVEWKREAEQELALVWLASTDRNGIASSAAQIDATLRLRPLVVGESRTSSVHRVLFIQLLCAEYLVIEDDKKVVVQHVSSPFE